MICSVDKVFASAADAVAATINASIGSTITCGFHGLTIMAPVRQTYHETVAHIAATPVVLAFAATVRARAKTAARLIARAPACIPAV